MQLTLPFEGLVVLKLEKLKRVIEVVTHGCQAWMFEFGRHSAIPRREFERGKRIQRKCTAWQEEWVWREARKNESLFRLGIRNSALSLHHLLQSLLHHVETAALTWTKYSIAAKLHFYGHRRRESVRIWWTRCLIERAIQRSLDLQS